MNGRPRFAWELYLKMDTGTESYQLLQVIANDAYKMGAFVSVAPSLAGGLW
jgi:intraflagellar transport protein 56